MEALWKPLVSWLSLALTRRFAAVAPTHDPDATDERQEATDARSVDSYARGRPFRRLGARPSQDHDHVLGRKTVAGAVIEGNACSDDRHEENGRSGAGSL